MYVYRLGQVHDVEIPRQRGDYEFEYFQSDRRGGGGGIAVIDRSTHRERERKRESWTKGGTEGGTERHREVQRDTGRYRETQGGTRREGGTGKRESHKQRLHFSLRSNETISPDWKGKKGKGQGGRRSRRIEVRGSRRRKKEQVILQLYPASLTRGIYL